MDPIDLPDLLPGARGILTLDFGSSDMHYELRGLGGLKLLVEGIPCEYVVSLFNRRPVSYEYIVEGSQLAFLIIDAEVNKQQWGIMVPYLHHHGMYRALPELSRTPNL